MRSVIIVAFVPLFIKEVLALKSSNFTVPKFAIAGQDVALSCKFDLQGLDLYALRWHKDGLEFYSYLPGNNPPMKAFNNASLGFTVDLRISDEGNIVLKNVSLKSEGVYMCHVTTEKPDFRKKFVNQTMQILVVPKKRPKIEGLRKNYKIGETVDLKCVASPSHPPVKLHWNLNGKPILEEYIRARSSSRDNGNLVRKTSTVSFKLLKEHLSTGKAKIECFSIISNIYNSSDFEYINHNVVKTREFVVNDDPSRYSRASAASANKRIGDQGCGSASFFSNYQCVILVILFSMIFSSLRIHL